MSKRQNIVNIQNAIDEVVDELHVFMPKSMSSDPVYRTYSRLMGIGIESDVAMRMIACVSIMVRMANETKVRMPPEVASAMYDVLPNSDPEKMLLSMCGK